MKLAFACPTYGPLEPSAYHSHLAAAMHASNHVGGLRWSGPANTNRMGHEASRNAIVKEIVFLPPADVPDAIFWVDADIILPAEAITRLCCGAGPGSFATGMYYQREGGHLPLAGILSLGKDSAEWGMRWFCKWPADSLIPADGCGFGCVLTGIEMFKEIEYPWFEHHKPVKGYGDREWSEDLNFCLKAKNAGFRLMCDTGVQCGHLKDPEPVKEEDFRKARREVGDASFADSAVARDALWTAAHTSVRIADRDEGRS